jgi:hypothetical protein
MDDGFIGGRRIVAARVDGRTGGEASFFWMSCAQMLEVPEGAVPGLLGGGRPHERYGQARWAAVVKPPRGFAHR